ncbi:DNA-binding Xre family transcriptional regulator [Paenibacillus phyllosphaerae]|uniref:DNA-binding Xre family transcriptional regulator n=1 Tax=Paenibacillus phyllosphaerae TaxID=274593 RepID=A0A7W5B040_9BACL|nr:helix-turn-helix transcriptional regulator [Paenibacillus phyllosphaerae]MBB3111963.1 DNA-binding Xre family transcriptional regulator [Paenibacillus phyllosphaerae]
MGKKVVIKIPELLTKHNISLRELSRLTDIRHAALSQLNNGKRQNINFSHIERLADTFDIVDIREIIELIDEEKRDS